VYIHFISLHSFLVFNGRVSVTDEVGQSPGFPYFSLAVRSRRLSPVEPINLADAFSVRRYAARRPAHYSSFIHHKGRSNRQRDK